MGIKTDVKLAASKEGKEEKKLQLSKNESYDIVKSKMKKRADEEK
jgi:hypothetical protein